MAGSLVHSVRRNHLDHFTFVDKVGHAKHVLDNTVANLEVTPDRGRFRFKKAQKRQSRQYAQKVASIHITLPQRNSQASIQGPILQFFLGGEE